MVLRSGADELQIVGRKRLQQREAVPGFFQQQPFGGQTLVLRQFAEIQRHGG